MNVELNAANSNNATIAQAIARPKSASFSTNFIPNILPATRSRRPPGHQNQPFHDLRG